ncbi:MAG TPA: hypothetical protein DCE42_15065 [Myxococcales bacterium]|nr:hypothetical protein [Deltaproteobacteria bacterium]MBU50096.1 hypothetical protein [Deltaproteobacteria bacterium]HAA56083.1 hypothetical protein [Myxococcales bacterium]
MGEVMCRVVCVCLLLVHFVGCTTTHQVSHSPLKTVKRKKIAEKQPKKIPQATNKMFFTARMRGGAFARYGRRPQGQLDENVVAAILRKARPLFARCARKVRHFFPDGLRAVQVRLWIGPTGKVWRSELESTVASVPRANRCFQKALRRLLFPQPQGDSFALLYETLSLKK